MDKTNQLKYNSTHQLIVYKLTTIKRLSFRTQHAGGKEIIEKMDIYVCTKKEKNRAGGILKIRKTGVQERNHN